MSPTRSRCSLTPGTCSPTSRRWLALFVAWFSKQPETPRKTYGYLRWEILAAFLNGATLLLISAWILWEAASRLRAPEPIEGGLMLAVAVGGLIVNLIAARVLAKSSSHNMNARGAYLHVLGDLLASVGTVGAAILIRYTGWLMADRSRRFSRRCSS